MKKIFVDTNIIVDLIADRAPFSKFAIDLFSKAEKKEVLLFTSSHSIATTHYLLKKYIEERELRNILFELITLLNVLSIDEETLKKGLRSKHKDFEDALQIICAESVVDIDFIVTRNSKDFKESNVQVLSPEELVLKL